MGAQDRVENAEVGLEPPCAAVAERGRDRVDVLDPRPPSGRPRGGAGLADAHGVDIVQPARAQVAQVTGGTGRTDRGDRAAVETDMPIKFLWSSNQTLRMKSSMVYAAAAAATRFASPRPRGAQGRVRRARPQAGRRARAAAACSMGHLNGQFFFFDKCRRIKILRTN